MGSVCVCVCERERERESRDPRGERRGGCRGGCGSRRTRAPAAPAPRPSAAPRPLAMGPLRAHSPCCPPALLKLCSRPQFLQISTEAGSLLGRLYHIRVGYPPIGPTGSGTPAPQQPCNSPATAPQQHCNSPATAPQQHRNDSRSPRPCGLPHQRLGLSPTPPDPAAPWRIGPAGHSSLAGPKQECPAGPKQECPAGPKQGCPAGPKQECPAGPHNPAAVGGGGGGGSRVSVSPSLSPPPPPPGGRAGGGGGG
jgi:translation initiation factor IF-2